MKDKNNDETMFLYVGAYQNEDLAKEDYEDFLSLHKEGWVGEFDAGIVAKDQDGRLDIKRHTSSTGKGTRRGLAVGALLGVIFPPSILASSVVGLTAGAAVGHHFNDISKDDLREVGSFLEDREAALVIVGESRVQEMVDESVKSALKEYKKEFNASAKDYNKELDKTIKAI